MEQPDAEPQQLLQALGEQLPDDIDSVRSLLVKTVRYLACYAPRAPEPALQEEEAAAIVAAQAAADDLFKAERLVHVARRTAEATAAAAEAAAQAAEAAAAPEAVAPGEEDPNGPEGAAGEAGAGDAEAAAAAAKGAATAIAGGGTAPHRRRSRNSSSRNSSVSSKDRREGQEQTKHVDRQQWLDTFVSPQHNVCADILHRIIHGDRQQQPQSSVTSNSRRRRGGRSRGGRSVRGRRGGRRAAAAAAEQAAAAGEGAAAAGEEEEEEVWMEEEEEEEEGEREATVTSKPEGGGGAAKTSSPAAAAPSSRTSSSSHATNGEGTPDETAAQAGTAERRNEEVKQEQHPCATGTEQRSNNRAASAGRLTFKKAAVVFTKCPITQTEYVHPVSTRFAPGGCSCIHVYERDAICKQLSDKPQPEEGVPCPFAGCRATLRKQQLQEDIETKHYMRRLAFREAQAAASRLQPLDLEMPSR